MKSALFVLILWLFASEALYQVLANSIDTKDNGSGYCCSAMQAFLGNLATLEHENNTRIKENIKEKVLVATISDLKALLQQYSQHIQSKDKIFIEFIEQKNETIKKQEEVFTLKIQEITKKLENLKEVITKYSIDAARKDSQIQQQIELLNNKSNEIKDLRDTILNKQKNQEILRNKLENVTEVITNYKIEAARKDSQIIDKNEQLNTKSNEIKGLKEQILNNQKNEEILQNKLENLTEITTNYKIEAARKDSEIQNQIKLLNNKTNEIKDLKDQILNKQKNQERIQNKLKNLTEVMTNYRIEAARNDSQIIDKNEQLNTKRNEIKELRDQIEITQKELISLKYQTQSVSEKLNSTKEQLAKYTSTEQCPTDEKQGYFQIKICGINTFQALCTNSGWMVIQRRFDGRENFNRSWNDYKEGFGDLAGEFFFGLEKLHLMTDARTYDLYIQLEDVNGTISYALYNDFKIGSEKESFYLKSLGKNSGTAGPLLNYQNQAKFSTFDRDSTTNLDKGITGCVRNHGGGWWYKSCGLSSLNGKYYKNENHQNAVFGIYWQDFQNFNILSFTSTKMLIKPTS